MLRKLLSLALAAALLLAAPALASEYYSARTPLNRPGDAKLNNIRLAAEAIDGAVIPGGGGFSFNETVGPRVKRRGYMTAPNGRGALVTGGGVAQAASTLYLALLELGDAVEIDPVRTYGSLYVDRYVDDPDQAIVTDYDADIDLSFTNLGEDMTVDMWVGDDYLYCSITVGDRSDAWSFAAAPAEGDAGDFAPVQEVWFTGQRSGAARDLLGSSGLDCGGDSSVLTNVELAAGCVNDTTLTDRDIFSFNDIVGPRDSKYGYVKAVNGRGAEVVGGGVAQVASAVWLAVKDMEDISVIEKSTYGSKYNQDYVDSSADAILTDYSAGLDFSFRYTGEDSITIYTYVSGGWLYCDVYSD